MRRREFIAVIGSAVNSLAHPGGNTTGTGCLPLVRLRGRDIGQRVSLCRTTQCPRLDNTVVWVLGAARNS
jgi:hypothetical protein